VGAANEGGRLDVLCCEARVYVDYDIKATFYLSFIRGIDVDVLN
jgi:hypothetical protein